MTAISTRHRRPLARHPADLQAGRGRSRCVLYAGAGVRHRPRRGRTDRGGAGRCRGTSSSEAQRLARTLSNAVERRLTRGPLSAPAIRARMPDAYPDNRCNLGALFATPFPWTRAAPRSACGCVRANADAELPILPEPVAYAAARLVARNCAAKGKPLTLVLHGGGEPTLHWDLLERSARASTGPRRITVLRCGVSPPTASCPKIACDGWPPTST